MRYYKLEDNGYITALGIGDIGTEITLDEYTAILDTMSSKPKDGNGTAYELKDDLTWESFERIIPKYVVIPSAEERLATIKSRIEALRDASVLPSTKALYDAILDLFE